MTTCSSQKSIIICLEHIIFGSDFHAFRSEIEIYNFGNARYLINTLKHIYNAVVVSKTRYPH